MGYFHRDALVRLQDRLWVISCSAAYELAEWRVSSALVKSSLARSTRLRTTYWCGERPVEVLPSDFLSLESRNIARVGELCLDRRHEPVHRQALEERPRRAFLL